jgi:ubiquitin-protein ligase E3 C
MTLFSLLLQAIQSKTLSQLKFADFFLQKILAKHSDTRLDIDYLASLDPEVYKWVSFGMQSNSSPNLLIFSSKRNLLYLNNLKDNVENLDLNFTIDINEFGETKSIELKRGGKDIAVTNENKIEYIHLLADYKLNRQVIF